MSILFQIKIKKWNDRKTEKKTLIEVDNEHETLIIIILIELGEDKRKKKRKI